jgi:hypothetical protein
MVMVPGYLQPSPGHRLEKGEPEAVRAHCPPQPGGLAGIQCGLQHIGQVHWGKTSLPRHGHL